MPRILFYNQTAPCHALQDRLAYGQVYGVAPERKGPNGSVAPQQQQQSQGRGFAAPTGGGPRRRRSRADAGEGVGGGGSQPDEDAYVGSRCSLQPRACP